MGRLLVADDDTEFMSMITAELSGSHDVVTVSTGLEVLAQIRRELPDLVILDITMPGLIGHEVASAVRADPATSALPIIMMTASPSGLEPQAAHLAGATLFIAKPFALADLSYWVDRLLLEAPDGRPA